MPPRRNVVWAIGLVIVGLRLAPAALGHLVVGTTTLSRLVADADLVARVRVVDADELVVLPDGSRRSVVVAQLLEVLAGTPPAAPTVRFAQHGHGVARYQDGEEAVVFLREVARTPELRALGVAFVSGQEHEEKVGLDDGRREERLAAVRAYVALGAIADPGERRAAWRRLTHDLLRSPDRRLAWSALEDVVRLGERSLDLPTLPGGGFTDPVADATGLLRVVDDAAVMIGIRLALLTELEHRGLVAGAPRWRRLLRTTTDPDRLAVVRAAGAHPSPPVTKALLRVLRRGGPTAAEAAAAALGAPGHAASVPYLARALRAGPPRVRMAAVRGLGGIADERARAALADAALTHADPATRQRAGAEVRVLDR